MDFLSGAGSLTCEGEVNMHIYRVREWGMSPREVEETKKERRPVRFYMSKELNLLNHRWLKVL